MKIENDNMGTEAFEDFLIKAFANMNDALKPGGAFYIWHASRTQKEFEQALNESNLKVKEQIIWVKNAFVFGRADYQWKHEPCFYGWKDGAPHYFTNDRTQTTVIEDAGYDFDKMKKQEAVDLLKSIFADKEPTTVIHENRPTKNDLHPTMKPLKLIARLIHNSSKEQEKVLDLFGGSGSTLMACEQLNRKCYMMEYDPKYVDVIIQRWELFTGQKAVQLNG